MRTVKVILTVAFLFGTFALMGQTRNENSRNAEVVFLVSMDCHSCEQKIIRHLPHERGVVDLSTDLNKRQVTIKYRANRTDTARLKSAIEKLGYTCEEVTEK